MYQCSCCYSSETGLDKLWPRVHDVVSRAMTLWADEHLREPAWANADTAGIVIKSRAFSDSIWRQPGATVWTKLISNLHSARTIWYSSNWIDLPYLTKLILIFFYFDTFSFWNFLKNEIFAHIACRRVGGGVSGQSMPKWKGIFSLGSLAFLHQENSSETTNMGTVAS